MSYLLSIFTGLIQGLTEFLPVSSSGHLVIFHDILNFNLPDNLLFDVVLHLGTFAALVMVFHREIKEIICGFFSSLFNWNYANDFNQRLAWLIIIGTIPAVIVGYFFEDFIAQFLRFPLVVALMMIIVAFLFFISEKYAVREKEISSLRLSDSLMIGLLQVLAFIPGVSRSGITIVAGLNRRLKREEAARFSFLLSLPIVFGAGLKKIIGIADWSKIDFLLLFFGFFVSALSGYFAIKFLLKYFCRHSLNIFAWYRLIIGCLILIWLIFFGI